MTNPRRKRIAKEYDLMSVRDAARELGMLTASVHYRVRLGALKAVRLSNCALAFAPDEVRRFKGAEARRRAAIEALRIGAKGSATKAEA